MRKDEFTALAPGALVPVENGCAFIANPLPPDLQSSWSIHSADERARGALGEVVGQARLIQNEALIVRPLLTREAVESNKIENTITRAAEVLLQEAGRPPADPEKANDNSEVLRYLHTLALGESEIRDGRSLSLHLLRSLHMELLKGSRGEYRGSGVFRTEPVLIGKDGDDFLTARFVPSPWEHVQSAMDGLEQFIAQPPPYSPLIACALLHYQFETIHPFHDGNGRLGRLMLPLYLQHHGVIDRSILYLSPYFEAHRDMYIELLKRVSTHGDWEAWILFFLQGVLWQAQDARDRVKRIMELQARYRERARSKGRTKATLPAIDVVMERVVVTARDIQNYVTNLSDNTARAAIRDLVALKILNPVPLSTFPQRWWAQELIDQVYQS